MDIDIYQPCPCNSGKKIKFCCAKDITADLNQILSKSAAKQSAAAIDLIDRVVDRVGQRDCLSIIKTHILLSSEEIAKAREVNDQFLKVSPKHPIGLQHLALIQVGERDIAGSVKSLQKAMNSISGNEIPISFGNAFRTVGAGLLAVGHLLAARAHFNYALMLREDDEQAQSLLIQTYRVSEVTMLFKHDLRLDAIPDDESLPWYKHYNNVFRALDRGQFLFALKILHKADSESPGVPQIKRGIAILTTNLAMDDDMAGAWREYAQLPGISRWDAVEAEAYAQMFDSTEITPEIECVALTMELSNLETASEVAIASPRMVAHDVPEQLEESQGPPPRFLFVVLDRDQVKDPEGLTIDNVPHVIGELLMYGKQTDREARIELVTKKTESFDELNQFVTEAFGQEMIGELTENVLYPSSQMEHVLTWNWHLPQGVTREQYEELHEAMRRRVMLEKWPSITFNLFDGLTAAEAAKEEKYHVPLEALMIQLESSADQQTTDDDLTSELREKLGLPQPESVDPTTLSDRLLSPIRQKYLIVEKLTDEQLVALQSEAMTIGNMVVLRKILPVILSRPSTAELIPHDLCHSVMAQLVEDDESFRHLEMARKIAKENGREYGVYLVQELEISILRGKRTRIQPLLREIETKHLREPNVEYQLVRVLQRFGLIGPDGRMPAAPAAAPEPGGVWTPDGGAPAAEPETEPEESKLWIPGQ